jgi:hypothetical protein
MNSLFEILLIRIKANKLLAFLIYVEFHLPLRAFTLYLIKFNC